MFACPLFREFHKPNKTAKLKGANINCRPKIGRNYYSISNYMVLIRQNKRGQNNFACKVANFYGSQIKGFYSNDDFIGCHTPVCNHVCRWLTACPCTRLSTGLIYQSPVLSWGRRQFWFRPRQAVRHAASPVSIHVSSCELLKEAAGDPNARIDIDSVQKLLNLAAVKFSKLPPEINLAVFIFVFCSNYYYYYYSAPVVEWSIVISLSVCLCVCLSVREHISGSAGPMFTKFSVQVPCGRG